MDIFNNFNIRLKKDDLRLNRIALIVVAVSFPIVGIIINRIAPEIYDPLYLRLIIALLTVGVFTGTFFEKIKKKYRIYFDTLLVTIVIWTDFIAFMNNFSFQTSLIYIAAISIVSFALTSYKEVALFSVISLIITILFLLSSNIPTVDIFSFIVSIIFIQFVAFIVIRSKNNSEKKLKESEEKLQAIIRSSPDGIGISDINGNIEFVAPQTQALWGYNSEEFIGKHIYEVIDEKSHATVTNMIEELLKGNNLGALEYDMIRKDGSHFICEANCSLLYNNKNQPEGVVLYNETLQKGKKQKN